jgi:hypothetical protein
MGQAKNAKIDAKDKVKESRRNALERRVQGSSGGADWNSANAQLLVRAIERVALSGGALRFGYTRDGGAYAIGVYGDGEPYTLYISPRDDINGVLEGIVEAW